MPAIAMNDEVIRFVLPASIKERFQDKPFLEAAVYVGGVLVTNDVRDFPFAGVRILKAGEFLRFADACEGA
ncbi:MAG: hypothetical protein IJ111_02650 [Eggerthellaceae bacterium]|nr:hypothetical protein [Eggerthellaceae bacterium]